MNTAGLPDVTPEHWDDYVKYVKKFSYGKYTIYKYTNAWPGVGYRHKSETLAKGLTKEEADGFLKLLKGNEE